MREKRQTNKQRNTQKKHEEINRRRGRGQRKTEKQEDIKEEELKQEGF